MVMNFPTVSKSKVTRIGGVNVEGILEMREALETEVVEVVLEENEELLVVMEGGEVRIWLVPMLLKYSPRLSDLLTRHLLNLLRIRCQHHAVQENLIEPL
ncbi:unnamed protein product [Arabis nemorensis]|uniref:Uncharacterized protein n=1 Tax=Arabis nemorensis TaxID=586526 RepID=A0A565CTJ1_9BRAS|nr:unnamed protein product [Arabis nemorensis]